MKEPKPVGESRSGMTRLDVERVLAIARREGEIVLKLKEAVLNGDALLEHQLVRELCGLPKETRQ